MANNDQSDLGGNKVTGNAAQRTAGRGGVDSRELPILDGSPLFHFATIGASANVAAPAAPKASGESPPPAQPARETQAKESTIDRLRREITEHVAAKRGLKTELEQSAARIADLIAALAERDAALAQGSRTLEEFQQASIALQAGELSCNRRATDERRGAGPAGGGRRRQALRRASRRKQRAERQDPTARIVHRSQ